MNTDAIASAVGDRSWRAWAGRSGGGDFAVSDLGAGVLRGLQWHWRGRKPPPGHKCPVCFDTFASVNEWQRLWCGCWACRTCIGTWVQTALEGSGGASLPADGVDAQPIVALSCPACAAPLRPCDTADVLSRDAELLTKFDHALRDAALRGSRDYRPCPQCAGGGYLTWACVTQARDTARMGALFVAWLSFGAATVAGAAQQHFSSHVTPCFAGIATLLLDLVVARVGASVARSLASSCAANAPLDVSCPECDASFSLAAADAAADAAVGGASAGDDAWVKEHTRPCPRASCRAPILKQGGCNAMRCSRCRLVFCWACMQPMRQCTHFTCANGAPHGNSSLWDEVTAANGDRLALRGDRAALFARCSAALCDALALTAAGVLLLQLCGLPDLAMELAQTTDSLLSLPATALRGLTQAAAPAIVLAARLVASTISNLLLGTLLIISAAFAMHGVGADPHIRRFVQSPARSTIMLRRVALPAL